MRNIPDISVLYILMSCSEASPLLCEDVLREDDVLLASCVEYVTEGVWKTDIFSEKMVSLCVSFTLPCVKLIDEKQHKESIKAMTTAINDFSRRILFRVDYAEFGCVKGTDMITVLVGDIIFFPDGPATAWVSLQESLVRHHIGYVSRPSPFRWEEIEKLSRECPLPHGYEQFSAEAKCRVLDVARGDTFIVEWEKGAPPYPPILVLRGTPSERYKDEGVALTKCGYEALRWSRRFIGKTLSVHIHTVTPSEKELACNSYAINLDRRGAVEGLAMCGGEDIGTELVRRHLATVREVLYPLNAHYLSLFSETVKFVEREREAAEAEEGAKDSELDVLDRLRKTTKLKQHQAEGLLKFLHPMWEKSRRSSKNSLSYTRHLFHQFMCGGDYNAVKIKQPIYRPLMLRAVLPMFKVAQLAAPLKGTVLRTYLHPNVTDQRGEKQNVIQVDVEVFGSDRMWERYIQLSTIQRSSYICWYPEPEEDLFRSELSLSVYYMGTEKVEMFVCSKMYDYNTFDESKHTVEENERIAVKHAHYDFPSFKAKKGTRSVLVCDVFIKKEGIVDIREEGVADPATGSEGNDEDEILIENLHHQRVLYYLSTDEQATSIENEDDLGEIWRSANVQEVQDEEALSEEAQGGIICVVPFFFYLPAEVNPMDFPELQRVSDVLCLPLFLAEVNGSLGFLGDLLLPRDEEGLTLDTSVLSDLGMESRSLLELLGGTQMNDGSMVQKIKEESTCRRKQLLKEKEVKLLSLPLVLLRAGKARRSLFVDTAELSVVDVPQMQSSIFPKDLSFLSLSIITRHLVPENSVNSMKITTSSKEDSYENHMDYHLWTDVNFPTLPNIFCGHANQLPHSLRNTERSFCAHLIREAHDKGVAGGAQESEFVVYAGENAMSTLMALLFHLRLCAVRHHYIDDYSAMKDSESVPSWIPGRLQNLDKLRPTYSTRMVLYRLPGNSNTVFLGSRDSHQMDFLEVPSRESNASDLIQLSPKIFRRLAWALAFESLVEIKEEKRAGGAEGMEFIGGAAEVDQVCGITNIGYRRRAQSLPFLYHPLPWLHVLGRPLMTRKEDMFAVRYSLPFLSVRHLYKAQSYGRIGKKEIRRHQERMWRKLQYIRDWCSLLLSRSHPHTAKQGGVVANGILYLFGVPREPISVHYMTKKQMRVSEAIPKKLGAEQLSDAEREHADLSELAEPAREILREINEAFKSSANTRYSLSIESTQPLNHTPDIRVKIHRVGEDEISDLADDMTETWEVYDTSAVEGIASDEAKVRNPYRPFSNSIKTEANPDSEMKIEYDLRSSTFKMQWIRAV